MLVMHKTTLTSRIYKKPEILVVAFWKGNWTANRQEPRRDFFIPYNLHISNVYILHIFIILNFNSVNLLSNYKINYVFKRSKGTRILELWGQLKNWLPPIGKS